MVSPNVSQERLYLDYNATSPLSHSVIDYLRGGDLLFANPSSQHSDGKAARKIINESRQVIYDVFKKNPKDTKLFFHSGATEAVSTFVFSYVEWARRENRELLICLSELDHPCVNTLRERFLGNHVRFFELKRDEELRYLYDENFSALQKEKEQNPELIILYHHLWVHNETGQVEDLENLQELKKVKDLYIHVDAVQAPGKTSHWNELVAGDIWTFSAHKFGALKGVGFSFFRGDLEFFPMIQGGGQQGNLRSGTENALGVKTVSLALKDLEKVDVSKTAQMRSRLLSFLLKELSGIGGVVSSGKMASNTIYFYLNDLTSDIALALFDLNGIEISAGSACSSGAAKDSLILVHKKLKGVTKNGLRISLPFEVSEELLEITMKKMTQIFLKLKR